MNLPRNVFWAAALALPFIAPVVGKAATATSTLNVSATVTNTCTVSGGALAFGTIQQDQANTANTTISVNCTIGAAANVLLGQGANAGALSTDASPVRRMKAGANFLPYGLYASSGALFQWDNKTGVATTGTGNDQSMTVYGKITAADAGAAAAGAYTDTITITVSY